MGGISSTSLGGVSACPCSPVREYWWPCSCRYQEWPAALFRPGKSRRPAASGLPALQPRGGKSVCEKSLPLRPPSGPRSRKRWWQCFCCPWAGAILNASRTGRKIGNDRVIGVIGRSENQQRTGNRALLSTKKRCFLLSDHPITRDHGD